MTRKNRSRILGGLFAAVLGASAALAFGACSDEADDCHNTATCVPPAYCYEAGDAVDEVDGCFGFR
jgi:hypothetical protein